MAGEPQLEMPKMALLGLGNMGAKLGGGWNRSAERRDAFRHKCAVAETVAAA